MANSSTQNAAFRRDHVILSLGLSLFALGVLGFVFLQHYGSVVRLLCLAGSVLAAVVVLLFSAPGKEFIAFSRNAYIEVRKVVWPTPQETGKMTLVVFIFALVMAMYLWASDKAIEWLIFSLILRWK